MVASRSTLQLGLALSLAAAVFGEACSASNEDDPSGQGGSAAAGAGGPGGSDTGFTTGTGGGSTGVGGGCAATSSKAQKIPLDMYIMLDQSGSMDESAGSGTKWQAVTQALSTFVQQPGLDGVGVGIQYFGVPPGGGAQCGSTCFSDADCGAAVCGPCFVTVPGFPGICLGGSGGDSCDPNDYATPEVEIAPLPGVASAIINSMAAHSPTTGTPTSPALQGAVQHARDWRIANPSHVVIAVLATDGVPQSCDTDLNNINGIAAAGANGNPQVLTFVIGVGPELGALNGIAQAGGTGQAFLVDSSPNAEQQFLDAMNAIRGSALACSYQIPVPQSGTPDFNAVNVQYTPGDGGQPVVIPKVANEAACPPSGLAWYYDDNASPTQIILCDGACAQISADATGQIDILLGCETVVE
ncbi:MAG: VWA domain-containing protein [Polyangiaceae bacterium]|nr:VWA domain-containing protein [Polyangiaceae bacterium]